MVVAIVVIVVVLVVLVFLPRLYRLWVGRRARPLALAPPAAGSPADPGTGAIRLSVGDDAFLASLVASSLRARGVPVRVDDPRARGAAGDVVLVVRTADAEQVRAEIDRIRGG